MFYIHSFSLFIFLHNVGPLSFSFVVVAALRSHAKWWSCLFHFSKSFDDPQQK